MAAPSTPRSVLELLKPVTWFAPMWAYGCGIVSAGVALQDRWLFALGGVLLAGPLVCGTSQAVNDWFDRHVDAINEPDRPIPSGRIPGRWGLYISLIGTALSLLVAALLGTWVLVATVVALVLAWLYSMPPIRLKQNGWWGNAAVGLSYEGIAWFTGAAAMLSALPGGPILALAALYSLGAHGIMTLNDFKAVEGDRKMGVASLPVQLGVDNAARLACVVMAVPQLVVIGLLLAWDRPYHAATIVFLLAFQMVLMTSLVERPRERAPWYNATGTSLYVLGMLVSAFAVRDLVPLAG
ncbi:chlorophyll synthase ChlG [Wenzhouxiangella sp. XN79A]|uniref:chlorophyll synthase ChlG n=1 Tax=Wenzhouxiangella sp. XN79A TaxID=2724193 RepID=UPI00144A5352|nr:chlorophyll synthase ChlG [Wenzhouxiangella sp. XN79A]NKI34868.1 chlorophyll synthase ChlG [Wenzhouxiangella sp. XN79A]